MWFSSSFGDELPCTSGKTSKSSDTRKCIIKQIASGSETRYSYISTSVVHKRKRENSDCNSELVNVPNKKVTFSQCNAESSSLLYVDKYAPDKLSDLAVHKRKIEEVEQWISRYSEKKEPRILFIHGPSGSGKSTAVKLICMKLNIELIEWDSAAQYDSYCSESGSHIIYERSQECNIDSIKFNPSALTFLIKAIERISLASMYRKEPKKIKRIAEMAQGDIRLAVNNFQFYASINDKQFEGLDCLSSDFSLDFFHSIGKVMYAKRKCENECREESVSLQSDLAKTHARPYPLKEDVNLLVDAIIVHSESLPSYVFEHEINFAPSLDSLRHALNDISYVDAFLCSQKFQSHSVYNDYQSQIAARTAMFYNYGVEGRKGGLYTFNKPRCLKIDSEAEAFQREARAKYPSIRKDDLFTIIYPLLGKIDRSDYQLKIRDSACSYETMQKAMLEDNFDIEECVSDFEP